MRGAAAERFAGAKLPTDALEDWRYSRIDALDLDRFAPATAPVGSGRSPHPWLDALLDAIGPAATYVETHNGHLVQVRSDDTAVTVRQPAAADSDPVGSDGLLTGEDPFAWLNHAFAPSPLRLTVPGGHTASLAVVVHWVDGFDVAAFPRLTVEVGEDADAEVIEIVTGTGGPLVIPVTELDLAPAGRLRYVHLQDLSTESWQIARQASRVSRDATLTSAAVALGGDYARLRTTSALVGPGASSRLLAMYFAAGSQMHDFRTVQGHEAPKTRSDLLYKGVVANSSRSVYSGLIRVEKGAGGSNAFQTNRNLVLHEGAHADSVPNLEIEDNDVRCSHASAVGPIDEDQHFYLESRGVPPGVADRLIALGFLGEVLDALPAGSVVAPLRAAMATKLAQAESLELAQDEEVDQ